MRKKNGKWQPAQCEFTATCVYVCVHPSPSAVSAARVERCLQPGLEVVHAGDVPLLLREGVGALTLHTQTQEKEEEEEKRT